MRLKTAVVVTAALITALAGSLGLSWWFAVQAENAKACDMRLLANWYITMAVFFGGIPMIPGIPISIACVAYVTGKVE